MIRLQSRVPSTLHRLAQGRLVDRVGVRMPRIIIGIGALFMAAYLTAILGFPKSGGRIVFGDATHHFVQLRSLVFDRDLQFQNEYMRLYGLAEPVPGTEFIFSELTPTGHVRNYMPIGPAILWAPLYLLVAFGQSILSLAGLADRPDGFGRAFQMVPGLTGIMAATAAAWQSWRLALRFSDTTSAAIATLAVWLGSHALYYSLVSPSYSHTESMLTGALFFSYWLSTRHAMSTSRLIMLGALAGLCALMRWQDAVFVLIPAIEALLWRVSMRQRVLALAGSAAACLAVFSPQSAVWQVLYGRAFAVPQGPSFMQWTEPHPWLVLFSTNHGLFTWAPVLLLAAWGLIRFARAHQEVAPQLAAVLVLSWYVNAAVADWWAGEAFGARRFLSLFPLFVLGVAVWLRSSRTAGPATRASGLRIAIASGFVVLNCLLLLQYQVFMKGFVTIAPYPSGWVDMWLMRFVVPVRLIAWWLT